MTRRTHHAEHIQPPPDVAHDVGLAVSVLRALFPAAEDVHATAVRHYLDAEFRTWSGLGWSSPTWITAPALRACYVAAAALAEDPEEAMAAAWEARAWGKVEDLRALRALAPSPLPGPIPRSRACWYALEGLVEVRYLSGGVERVLPGAPEHAVYQNLLRRGAIGEQGWRVWHVSAKPHLAGRSWPNEATSETLYVRKGLRVPWWDWQRYFPLGACPVQPLVDYRTEPTTYPDGPPALEAWRAVYPEMRAVRTRGRNTWLIRQPVVDERREART